MDELHILERAREAIGDLGLLERAIVLDLIILAAFVLAYIIRRAMKQ